MSDFTLTATRQPKPVQPAKRPSPLSALLLGLLRQYGQMPRCDLVSAALSCLKEHGKPAHRANIYTRLRALKAAGQVEVRRMDGTSWVILPGSGKSGRRHVIQGHATVRRGKAKFTAKAPGCPAFSGAATLSFIK
jgi:hypothetical protein